MSLTGMTGGMKILTGMTGKRNPMTDGMTGMTGMTGGPHFLTSMTGRKLRGAHMTGGINSQMVD